MSDGLNRRKRPGGSKGRVPKRAPGDPALGLAREVRRNALSISGIFNHGSLSVAFESGLERKLIAVTGFIPGFKGAVTQPARVGYTTAEGRNTTSFPDILASFETGDILYDVKPFKDLVTDWDKLLPKFEAAKEHANSQGWEYRIVTDAELESAFSQNADFLMKCRLSQCSEADLQLAEDTARTYKVADTEALARLLASDVVSLSHWQATVMRAIADFRIHVDLDQLVQGPVPIQQEPFQFRLPGQPISVIDEQVQAFRRQLEHEAQQAALIDNAPKVSPVLFIVPGETYRLGDEFVTVSRFSNVTSVVVIGPQGNERIVHLSELQPIVPDGIGGELVDRHWDKLTPQEQQIASARLAVVRDLAYRQNRPAPVIQEAAEKLNVSRSYLFRLLQRYETVPMPSSLAPLRRGPKSKRLNEAVEAEIEAAITNVMLTRQKNSLSTLQRAVEGRLAKVGMKVSKATIRRRYMAKDPRILIAARNSPGAARQLLEMERGKHRAHFPLHEVQIDSTWFDLFLRDEEDRLTTSGRAYLTVAICVFSRVVLGFHLSFRPVGAATAGQCIYNCISPKDRFLRELGLEELGEVPHGLFWVLHADGGREFNNSSIASFASTYDVSFHLRPILKPNWGGHIESLLDKVADRLKSMLGASFSNAAERDDYDSEAKAVMTLFDAKRWLAKFFWGEYHNAYHSGIGMSPLEKFAQGLLPQSGAFAAGAPRICKDLRRLMIELLPKYFVTVQPYGIRLDYMVYTSIALQAWRHRPHPNGQKFEVRRDPDDVTRIWFLDPLSNKYLECTFAHVIERPYSKEQIEEALEYCKAKGWEPTTDRILRTRRQMDEEEQTARQKTLKARRKAAVNKEAVVNVTRRNEILTLPPPDQATSPPVIAADLIPLLPPPKSAETQPVNLDAEGGTPGDSPRANERTPRRAEDEQSGPADTRAQQRPVLDLSKLRRR
ncbi:TnsA endonuclease N-terminal domain-containing protein [Indioceanicola profundi]|uniref:TnsA endonuclease N-terminal domain-containing protein n=1 Tax=Indioceanicola profundi TaxID=2220096 RepID=UPI000E6AB99F|nr:TnsA endonuclease N-terminal domain-containing protein [Indioceanicola profundi]